MRWSLPVIDHDVIAYTFDDQTVEHPTRAFIAGLLLAIKAAVTGDPVMGPSLEVEVRWLDEIITVVQGSGYAAEVPPVENKYMVEDYLDMAIVWWDEEVKYAPEESPFRSWHTRECLGAWKHLFLGYTQNDAFDRCDKNILCCPT